jgi:hypothetical protein
MPVARFSTSVPAAPVSTVTAALVAQVAPMGGRRRAPAAVTRRIERALRSFRAALRSFRAALRSFRAALRSFRAVFGECNFVSVPTCGTWARSFRFFARPDQR